MAKEQANMAARYEREIPEGYEARIEGNKVIIELKESEDERIRRMLIEVVNITPAAIALEHREELLAYLEKQKEQKPAEWSEEDEDTIEKAICVLEANFEPKEEFSGLDINRYQLVNRLKSLRPQPHWKPSEEQMKALLSKLPVVKGGGDKVQDILESLYDDLKKL